MDTVVLVLIVIAVLVIVAVALWAGARARKRRTLQERFGPEYDRVVAERGDRKDAEQHLEQVADRHEKLRITELDPETRRRYAGEWERVQSRFVDDPAAAVTDADRLVASVMRDRGYPVDDFETRAELVAADHPELVQHYRAAHGVRQQLGSGECDVDDLREAFMHYRALFDELLVDAPQR